MGFFGHRITFQTRTYFPAGAEQSWLRSLAPGFHRLFFRRDVYIVGTNGDTVLIAKKQPVQKVAGKWAQVAWILTPISFQRYIYAGFVQIARRRTEVEAKLGQRVGSVFTVVQLAYLFIQIGIIWSLVKFLLKLLQGLLVTTS